MPMTSVNYKGGGPAVNDLLGGHVQLYFSTISGRVQHIESGRLRAMAVTGKTRSPELPEVPTVSESGLPGFDVTAWFGLFAPARTPRPVIERLNTELGKILAMPDVRQKLAHHGVQPGGGTPDVAARFSRCRHRKVGQGDPRGGYPRGVRTTSLDEHGTYC